MNYVEFPGLGLTFNVDPVAFYIGTLPIYWYGIMIALGVMAAFIVGLRQAKKFGVNEDQIINAAFVGCIAGVIGARLYYVVFTELTYFAQTGEHAYASFWDVINIRDGGLAIYGGLIFGIGAAAIFCRIKKYKFLDMADCAAFGIPLAQALGRWGNFFNQEAWGSNTDLAWGMTGNIIKNTLANMNMNDNSLVDVVDVTMPVHPCFFYEFAWLLICFGLLTYWAKKRVFRGEMLLSYAVLYGVGRFIIEGLRMDSLMIGAFIRVSQLISALLVITGVLIIILLRSSVRKGRYPTISLVVVEETGTGFDDIKSGPVVVRDGEVVSDQPAVAKPKKKKKARPIVAGDEPAGIVTQNENEPEPDGNETTQMPGSSETDRIGTESVETGGDENDSEKEQQVEPEE